MEERILETLHFIESLPPLSILFFVFLSAFLENVFPPYPGDTVLVFSGFVAARGSLHPALSFLGGFAGSVLGGVMMFFLGHRFLLLFRELARKWTRPEFLGRMAREMSSAESMARVEYWFNRYGLLFVLFSRFSAGIRFFVTILAGIVNVRFPGFLLAFSGGVLIWNGLLFAGGFSIGQNWELVLEYLRLYNKALLALGIAAFCGWLIWRLARRSDNRD
jgi:membrane protein DedA with SNARE-associated domain